MAEISKGLIDRLMERPAGIDAAGGVRYRFPFGELIVQEAGVTIAGWVGAGESIGFHAGEGGFGRADAFDDFEMRGKAQCEFANQVHLVEPGMGTAIQEDDAVRVLFEMPANGLEHEANDKIVLGSGVLGGVSGKERSADEILIENNGLKMGRQGTREGGFAAAGKASQEDDHSGKHTPDDLAVHVR